MVTFCPSCRHWASAAVAMLSAASVESVASFSRFCAPAGTAQTTSINRDSPCFSACHALHRLPPLLELGAAFLYHLRPLGEIGGHEIAELARRITDRLRTVVDDALMHVGLREHAQQLVVQALGHRRHVRHRRDALRRGHRESTQLSRAHMRLRRLYPGEVVVVATADQIDE